MYTISMPIRSVDISAIFINYITIYYIFNHFQKIALNKTLNKT
jgi:hypothetical protein